MYLFYILLAVFSYFFIIAFVAIFSLLKLKYAEKELKVILQNSMVTEQTENKKNSRNHKKESHKIDEIDTYNEIMGYNISEIEKIVREAIVELGDREQKLLLRELNQKNETRRKNYIRKLFDFKYEEKIEFGDVKTVLNFNNMKFSEWVISQKNRISFVWGISLFFITCLIALVAAFLYMHNFINKYNNDLLIGTIRQINVVLQIIFIAFVLFVLSAYRKHFDSEKLTENLAQVFKKNMLGGLKLFIFNHDKIKPNVELAIDAHKAFVKYIFLFWVLLLCLYFSFFSQFIFNIPEGNIWLNCIEVFFNNLSVIALFSCYIILHKYRRDHFEINSLTIKLVILSLIFGMIQYLVLYFFGSGNRELESFFHGISGLLNAVFLALLIGKLDSKVIEAPAWIIMCLFSYAAIQPMFIFFFGNHPVWRVFTLYAALLLKILFFAFLMWVIRANLLKKYLLFSLKVDQCIHDDSKIINPAFADQIKLKSKRKKFGTK